MISRVTILLGLAAALAACTSPAQQRINQQRHAATQFLERVGSVGDPGRVAAADFAFARMAIDEGQWTAFRAYVAPNAVMNTADGFAPASELLAGRVDPEEPVRWEPTNVWSSCDGTLAVSLGRFVLPDGLVGDYVTVWQLQSDNSYKWTYDTGTPDDPQPQPEIREELPEGAIVVEGMTSIEGRIADCEMPQDDAGLQIRVTASETRAGQAVDGTLNWLSDLQADGSRQVRANYFRNGAWEQVVDLTIPAQASE